MMMLVKVTMMIDDYDDDDDAACVDDADDDDNVDAEVGDVGVLMMMTMLMLMNANWACELCFSRFPTANAVCVVVHSALSCTRLVRKGTTLVAIRTVRTIWQFASTWFSRC
jgi:hypothetical protein